MKNLIFSFLTVALILGLMMSGGLSGCSSKKPASTTKVVVNDCLPVSTNWRLSPELNHVSWLADSLGCDGTRAMISTPAWKDKFNQLLRRVGRESVQSALGPPLRSYINAARRSIDVYLIKCRKGMKNGGETISLLYDEHGCLQKMFYSAE